MQWRIGRNKFLEGIFIMVTERYYCKGNRHIRVKQGFSWSVLFFGFWIPLIHHDMLWAVLLFVFDLVPAISTISSYLGVCAYLLDAPENLLIFLDRLSSLFDYVPVPYGLLITFGINLCFALVYNAHRYRRLERKGYVLVQRQGVSEG